ncbi:hypothetical protein [Paraglaciecola sp. L3A3]|uniref:hypothetical protein n=1 Tax=Paraglaciecola sp. L3A3 TaxID=2686358 RepID=UPI00131E2E7D|nr:hypothetical protein [Paraglaciecola sp. L3A3]
MKYKLLNKIDGPFVAVALCIIGFGIYICIGAFFYGSKGNLQSYFYKNFTEYSTEESVELVSESFVSQESLLDELLTHWDYKVRLATVERLTSTSNTDTPLLTDKLKNILESSLEVRSVRLAALCSLIGGEGKYLNSYYKDFLLLGYFPNSSKKRGVDFSCFSDEQLPEISNHVIEHFRLNKYGSDKAMKRLIILDNEVRKYVIEGIKQTSGSWFTSFLGDFELFLSEKEITSLIDTIPIKAIQKDERLLLALFELLDGSNLRIYEAAGDKLTNTYNWNVELESKLIRDLDNPQKTTYAIRLLSNLKRYQHSNIPIITNKFGLSDRYDKLNLLSILSNYINFMKSNHFSNLGDEVINEIVLASQSSIKMLEKGCNDLDNNVVEKSTKLLSIIDRGC